MLTCLAIGFDPSSESSWPGASDTTPGVESRAVDTEVIHFRRARVGLSWHRRPRVVVVGIKLKIHYCFRSTVDRALALSRPFRQPP